jgi:hypothetical protein
MSPKKKPEKELLVEGSSQAEGQQVLTTAQTAIQTIHIPQTLHPQPSINLHTTATNLLDQPTTQAEVLALNTTAPNTIPQPSHQNQTIEIQEGLQ